MPWWFNDDHYSNGVLSKQIENNGSESNPENNQNKVVDNDGCNNESSIIENISGAENFDENYIFRQLTENVN